MDEEFERKTEEKAQLVPPVRRPPTALGTGTPPPPPPPRRPPPPSSPSPQPWDPSSVRALVRRILATGVDVADIVAAALTRTWAQPPHRRGRDPLGGDAQEKRLDTQDRLGCDDGLCGDHCRLRHRCSCRTYDAS